MSASPPNPASLGSLSPVLTAAVCTVRPPAGSGGHAQGEPLWNWSHCPITLPTLYPSNQTGPPRAPETLGSRVRSAGGAEEAVRSPEGITLNGGGRRELDGRTRGLLSWSCGPGVPRVDRRHRPRRWEGEALLSSSLSHRPPLPSGPTPEEGGQEQPVAPPSRADRSRAEEGQVGQLGPRAPLVRSCTADRLTFLTPAWHFTSRKKRKNKVAEKW